jgi:hypothetical protein
LIHLEVIKFVNDLPLVVVVFLGHSEFIHQ